jgi:hypothetical protein
MTLEDKIEACVKYDSDWLQNGAGRADIEWIIRDGWKGWTNQSREAIEKFYKDNIKEDVRVK